MAEIHPPSVPAAHILPTAGLAKVPPFDPTKDLTAKSFIERLSNLAATFAWNDTQKLNAAISALQGRARTWYETQSENNPGDFTDYSRFENTFLARFKPPRNIAEQVHSLQQLFQKPDETVVDFFERIEEATYSIFKDVMPTGKTQKTGATQIRGHLTIVLFLNGLKTSLKSYVESSYDTPDNADPATKRSTLLAIAKRAEASNRTVKANAAPLLAAINRPQFRGRGSYRGTFRGARPRPMSQRSFFANNAPLPPANYAAQQSRPPPPPPPATPAAIAARRRWVKCLKCHRWGKHYARECPFPPVNIAEIHTEELPPPGATRDDHFDVLVLRSSLPQPTPAPAVANSNEPNQPNFMGPAGL